MARQTSSETLKSIAGSVLAGAGLFVLRATLEEAAQLSQMHAATPGDGLGLWHFVMVAASWNQHQVAQGLLQMFVTLWPLLSMSFIIVVAGWLWNESMEKNQGVS